MAPSPLYITRGPEFAVVQVHRSEKTNYLYKHFWDSYLLTETESKQCDVLSMEGKVPKHSYGHISIKFDDNIHKEVEVSVHDLCVSTVFMCIICTRVHFSYSIVPKHYSPCAFSTHLKVFQC